MVPLLDCLVHTQLVYLLPVEILNLLSLFQKFVGLALKSTSGETSIKYTLHYISNWRVKFLHMVDFQSLYTETKRGVLESVCD